MKLDFTKLVTERFIDTTRSHVNELSSYKIVLGTLLLKKYLSEKKFGEILNNQEIDIEKVIYHQAESYISNRIISEYLFSKVIPCMQSVPNNKIYELFYNVNRFEEVDFSQCISETISLIAEKCYSVYNFEFVQRIMKIILNVQPEDCVFDPFAGIGTNLLSLNIGDLNNIYGVEINSEVFELLKMNMFVHELDVSNLNNTDVFKYDANAKFDRIIADPPLGFKYHLTDERYNNLAQQGKVKYAKPGRTYAEWLSVEYILSCLNKTGVATVLMPTGPLMRALEKSIREGIVEDDVIEAIIELPRAALFPVGSVLTCILVLNRNKHKNRRNKILSIDLGKLTTGTGVTVKSSSIVGEIYFSDIDEYGISEYVDAATIKENDCNLYLSQIIESKKIKKNLKNMLLLGDVAEDIFRGIQLPKKAVEETDNDEKKHYLLNISNIVDGEILVSDDDKISATPKMIKTYSIKENDVIITGRGTFKVGVVKADNINCIASSNIIVIRINAKRYNANVIKQFFESDLGKKLISNIQTGATATTVINPNNLKELMIPDIDIDKQNIISEKIQKATRDYNKAVKEATDLYERNISEIYNLMGVGGNVNE